MTFAIFRLIIKCGSLLNSGFLESFYICFLHELYREGRITGLMSQSYISYMFYLMLFFF